METTEKQNPPWIYFWKYLPNFHYSYFSEHLETSASDVIWINEILSRQILVLRTSRGRPPPTSPGRLVNILLDRLGDVLIWRPRDVLKGRLEDVLIRCSRDVPGRLIRDVPRTSAREPSEYSNLDIPTFFLTFLSELIRLAKSI